MENTGCQGDTGKDLQSISKLKPLPESVPCWLLPAILNMQLLPHTLLQDGVNNKDQQTTLLLESVQSGLRTYYVCWTTRQNMVLPARGKWNNNFWWNILHTESNYGGRVPEFLAECLCLRQGMATSGRWCHPEGSTATSGRWCHMTSSRRVNGH